MADLQLDVKGCIDVYASFDKYVEVERLEGDNRYQAEEHGLQVSCSAPLVNNHIMCLSIYAFSNGCERWPIPIRESGWEQTQLLDTVKITISFTFIELNEKIGNLNN